MAKKIKNITVSRSRNVTADGHRYLTKRFVVRRAQAAGKKAAANAMELMGFVVAVENNNVIKRYADGKVEILTTVDAEDKIQKIVLD